MVQCVSQRESIVYFVDVFRNHLEEAVDLLMDTVLNANITETELEEGKENMMFQRDNLPPELISRDVRYDLFLKIYISIILHFFYCRESSSLLIKTIQ